MSIFRLLLAPLVLLLGLMATAGLLAVIVASPVPVLIGFLAVLVLGPRVFRGKPSDAKAEPFLPQVHGSVHTPAFVDRLLSTRPSDLLGPDQLPTLLGRMGERFEWFDLARAPHVLVGGATGSGKSVWLHSAIVTATAGASPRALRLVLIDPKRVEFARYRTLPHVAHHVTEPADALGVLDRLAAEMDRRYALLEALGARSIDGLHYPRILVVIDEFADLILTTRRTPHNVEPVLARLLSLGRAAGVHVILATQRPDRTVVTGLIKANAPMRVAFRTSNAIESRIILDAKGAEMLRGGGDGLVASSVHHGPKGEPLPFRGAMIPDPVLAEYVKQVLDKPTARV